MSHQTYNFAEELTKLLAEKRMTAADLRRVTGIHDAQLSRFKHGEQKWVNPEDLKSIAAAFTTGKKGESYNKIHARLLHAMLLDTCTGPGAKYIHIELLGQPAPMMLLNDAPNPMLSLPPKTRQNLEIVIQHLATNRNIRDLVETAANICNGGSLPQPNSE